MCWAISPFICKVKVKVSVSLPGLLYIAQKDSYLFYSFCNLSDSSSHVVEAQAGGWLYEVQLIAQLPFLDRALFDELFYDKV